MIMAVVWDKANIRKRWNCIQNIKLNGQRDDFTSKFRFYTSCSMHLVGCFMKLMITRRTILWARLPGRRNLVELKRA